MRKWVWINLIGSVAFIALFLVVSFGFSSAAACGAVALVMFVAGFVCPRIEEAYPKASFEHSFSFADFIVYAICILIAPGICVSLITGDKERSNDRSKAVRILNAFNWPLIAFFVVFAISGWLWAISVALVLHAIQLGIAYAAPDIDPVCSKAHPK